MRLMPEGSPSLPQQDEQPTISETLPPRWRDQRNCLSGAPCLAADMSGNGTILRSALDDRAAPAVPTEPIVASKMRDAFALDGGPYHFLTEAREARRRIQHLLGQKFLQIWRSRPPRVAFQPFGLGDIHPGPYLAFQL